MVVLGSRELFVPGGRRLRHGLDVLYAVLANYLIHHEHYDSRLSWILLDFQLHYMALAYSLNDVDGYVG